MCVLLQKLVFSERGSASNRGGSFLDTHLSAGKDSPRFGRSCTYEPIIETEARLPAWPCSYGERNTSMRYVYGV